MNHRRYVLLFAALFTVLAGVAASVGGANTVVASRKHMPANITDVPVLNYHKVDYLVHALSLSPQEFEEQMSYLHANGYHTITPDQLTAYLKYGYALPEKPVLITFDDGYLDNYTNAYPIMKRYGFMATIFLITSAIGNDERYMNWDQVREMQKDGFVFGSHTVTHRPLTKLAPEQITQELVESSSEMNRQLGHKPRYFAYPTGVYSLNIEEQVRQAGYKGAFTIRYGQVGLESDPYALERIPIFKCQNSLRNFIIRLTGAPLLERLGIIRN